MEECAGKDSRVPKSVQHGRVQASGCEKIRTVEGKSGFA